MALSIDKEVKSLKKFFRRLVYTVKNRRRFWVEESVLRRRRVICEGCEFLRPPKIIGLELPVLKRCSECGCLYKSKTKFEFEECPKGKW